MNVEEEILNFVRDASYKIGLLTTEMLDLSEDEDEEYSIKFILRERLIVFSKMVYDTTYSYRDGVKNRLMDWTDKDILEEIDYLRRMSNMNEVPHIPFIHRSLELITKTASNTSNGGSASIDGLPIGVDGDFLTFDLSGNLILTKISSIGGWNGIESVAQYFNR